MKKMPLKKLFHIDREAYKSEYEKRFNDDDTVHLDIEISGNAAFLCPVSYTHLTLPTKA